MDFDERRRSRALTLKHSESPQPQPERLEAESWEQSRSSSAARSLMGAASETEFLRVELALDVKKLLQSSPQGCWPPRKPAVRCSPAG